MQIHDVRHGLVTGPGDELAIKRSQEIPDDYLSSLRAEKLDSKSVRAGEFHRVGVVPVALVEQWQAEGYDVYKQPVEETLKRLRAAQLDAFITSNKRI